MNHECRLQIKVCEFLDVALPNAAIYWHVPNGGPMSDERRGLLAKMGEHKGAPDLMVMDQGKLICIELKVRKNPVYGIKHTTYQTKDQKAFQSAVEAAGAFYAVCRSIDDVQGSLTAFGVPLKARVA